MLSKVSKSSLQASLVLPVEATRAAFSTAPEFRVRTTHIAPLSHSSSSRWLHPVRVGKLGAVDRKTESRVGMSAQNNHGKAAGPTRWHSPTESRDCSSESRRTLGSKRRAAGGVLERDASTDQGRVRRTEPQEKGVGEQRDASSRARPRPAIALSGGVGKEGLLGGVEPTRLHNLGCEPSRERDNAWKGVELRGPLFVSRSDEAGRQRRRERAVEFSRWLPSPKERLAREAFKRLRLPEDQSADRTGLPSPSEMNSAPSKSSLRKTKLLTERPKTAPELRGALKRDHPGAPSQRKLPKVPIGTTRAADTSADGPSTSGRDDSYGPSRGARNGSIGGRSERYGGTTSGVQVELTEDSEEEEEGRKGGAGAVGELITYASLKKDDVDLAVRIEKRLLRDGLLVSQARALALYVVKNEIPGGYDAIRERLTFLESLHGLKPKQAVALLLAQKRTLKRPVDELQGNVGYLLTAGVPADQLGNVVRRSPQILLTSVAARLEPSVRCLRGLGLDVGKMVVKNPRVVSYDLEGRAKEVIEYLHSIGLRRDEVQALLEKDATLLTMTIETLAKKVEFLFRKSVTREAALDLIRSSPHALYADVEQAIEQVEMVFATFGLEVGDTFELLIKWPALMSMTKRPMLEKVEFVINELGWDVNDVLQYPLFLSFSLEKKLRPRCKRVLDAGIVIARPNEGEGLKLHTMLVCSDENFEHYLSEIWPKKYRAG